MSPMVASPESISVFSVVKAARRLRARSPRQRQGTDAPSARWDPLYPDWNVHFAIDSAQRTKLRSGETQFTMV